MVAARISADGFAIVDDVLDTAALTHLIDVVEREQKSASGRGGMRNLLDVPEMSALAACASVRSLVEPVLGAGTRVVRGILFDKTSAANWKVPWHQDVTIAVERRLDTDGYGAWSVKAGVQHVQPPAAVLERMLSVRLHLDDCPAENGALRVIAGSHGVGKLSTSDTEDWVRQGVAEVCAVRRGGALLMRPLLLHASSAATVPAHRRVLHFDFASGELAGGLQWAVKEG